MTRRFIAALVLFITLNGTQSSNAFYIWNPPNDPYCEAGGWVGAFAWYFNMC